MYQQQVLVKMANMENSRNMQRLYKRSLKLRLTEIGDDALFIDILKTLNFLDVQLKYSFNEYIEMALDYCSGINEVIEKSSDALTVKYYPDLIENFLTILTTTQLNQKLMDFLFVIQDMGVYVPEETKRFTFIELEDLFKRFVEFIRDEADYETQVMAMQIFVTFFSIFSGSERVKIVNNLFSEEFENSRYYLWLLKRDNFDLNCRLFLNAMNEENLMYNKKCNVYSIKAESITIGVIDLMPPMEDYKEKLELWIDFNFSNATITFYCDGKSFKKSDCVWQRFKINADNIQDACLDLLDYRNNELSLCLKSSIFTEDASVSNLVQIYKSVCFEFEQNSSFDYFCKKIWPAFQKRVWKSSPRTRNQPSQTVSSETTPQNAFCDKIIDSAFKETNEVDSGLSDTKEDEFKVPSVENIPMASLKRRYLIKLDTAEPKAKKISPQKINVVEPMAGPSYVHRIQTRKSASSSKSLSKQRKYIKSVKTAIDVYDFNTDEQISSPTPIRRIRSVRKNYLPHSDFVSPVKVSGNEKASFSYRADAKKMSSPTISQSDKLFDELLLSSKDEAQTISNDVEMLEADSSVVGNLGITEEEKAVTPKINFRNKRFKKYSPLNE